MELVRNSIKDTPEGFEKGKSIITDLPYSLPPSLYRKSFINSVLWLGLK